MYTYGSQVKMCESLRPSTFKSLPASGLGHESYVAYQPWTGNVRSPTS